MRKMMRSCPGRRQRPLFWSPKHSLICSGSYSSWWGQRCMGCSGFLPSSRLMPRSLRPTWQLSRKRWRRWRQFWRSCEESLLILYMYVSCYAFKSGCLGGEFIETLRGKNRNKYVFILCFLSVFLFVLRIWCEKKKQGWHHSNVKSEWVRQVTGWTSG